LFTILIIVHIIICLGLVIVVLLQSAKGEGLAGAFGGGGISGAVFGGRGAATFLSKATTYLAIAFMISSLGLTFISPATSASRQESAIKKELGGVPIGQQPTGMTPQPGNIPQQQQPKATKPTGTTQGKVLGGNVSKEQAKEIENLMKSKKLQGATKSKSKKPVRSKTSKGGSGK